MKVLFIGDYSNFHACLAAELRRRGVETTIVSDGGTYMKTYHDINATRESGLLNSFKYLYHIFELSGNLSGYDVVQLINPNYASLRPGKLKFFLERLRKRNGSLFLSLAGDDHFFVKECADGNMFRYSEFAVGKDYTDFGRTHDILSGWLSSVNAEYNKYVYDIIDGAMSALPEYDMAARPILGDRLVYTGIPIDLGQLKYSEMVFNDDKVNLFVGFKKEYCKRKGTDILLRVAKELEAEMPADCRVFSVSNISIDDYYKLMRSSNIVLDQLYSYSPATNALAAMALGKVAATGATPEYYRYLGNDYDYPIIPLSPLDENIKETLRSYILNRGQLIYMSIKGRKLVEKNNDVRIVADRFIEHWTKTLEHR